MQFLSHEEIIKSLNVYLKSIEERMDIIDNSIIFQKETKVPYRFIAISYHSKALLIAEKSG